MLTSKLIQGAYDRIKPRIHRTPVFTSRQFDEVAGRRVFFKCENLQRTGSFKIRGATNKILSLSSAERSRGVVAFSSGNHAQAVGLAGREAGIRVVVAMPSDAPEVKIAATKSYGAEIVFYDRLKQDRELFARRIAEDEGMVLIPPYDDMDVLAGQATCGLEFIDEVKDLDAILVPCSGGGLFAGVASAMVLHNERIRCFAVEPDTADDTRRSFELKERVKISAPPTIADALRVQTPGTLTFPITMRLAEDIITVTDEEILSAVRFLLFRMKLLVEPGGAVAAAAALFERIPKDIRRVGVVLSGGNIDAELLATLVRGTHHFS
jgi:threo-3-hydroxy-L-aspartate ammonia-lyase